MPTTNKEAAVISAITVRTIKDSVNNWLEEFTENFDVNNARDVAHDVFSNLVELAYQTENYSLRQSLFMIMSEVDPTFVPDYKKLINVFNKYDTVQPEMSRQEWLGLTDEQWLSFTEGTHVEH